MTALSVHPHLRHVRLREALDGREHLLLVYGDRDSLICWCGPYTAPEAYEHSLAWGAVGWCWAKGVVPAEFRPVKPPRVKSRFAIAEKLAANRTIRGSVPLLLNPPAQ
ncbi:MAG: hypothetical protein PGN16_10695 [Sphingomonas phyllosphaerae]|uniref:hypothetical protein n=1 Tax=Sphingomonas phyllosphaerae TaxID=257003 RepID=UPI002FFAAA77